MRCTPASERQAESTRAEQHDRTWELGAEAGLRNFAVPRPETYPPIEITRPELLGTGAEGEVVAFITGGTGVVLVEVYVVP